MDVLVLNTVCIKSDHTRKIGGRFGESTSVNQV